MPQERGVDLGLASHSGDDLGIDAAVAAKTDGAEPGIVVANAGVGA